MAGEKEYIRVDIDGEWSAHDFAKLFSAISIVFDIEALVWALSTYPSLHSSGRRIGLRSRPYYPDEFDFFGGAHGIGAYAQAAGTYNLFGERLRAEQVQYASPGFGLFSGSGELVKELRETVLAVVHADHHRKMNHHAEHKAASDAERAELDVELKRVQLWKEKADLLRIAGFAEDQVAAIIADGIRNATFISEFAQSGMIKRISDGMD